MNIIVYLLLLLSHAALQAAEEQTTLYKKEKKFILYYKCPCCWAIYTKKEYAIHRLKECPQFFGNWKIEN